MGSLAELLGGNNILNILSILNFLDGSVAMIEGSADALGGDT